MNVINKNWLKIVFLYYVLISPFSVLYASDTCKEGTICNPIPTITSIPVLIKTILEGVLTIGIPVVALAVVYCGFLFVFARGNPEKLSKAKEALLYTLIGAAILLGSLAIANIISGTIKAL
jgi:hypothetical protein